MSRLDDYRSALLAAFPDVSDAELAVALDKCGADFVSFVIDHGLGPLWHERTKREEFHASRLSAEALYLAQEHALKEIDAVLDSAGIEYAVLKGAASRLLLYENPAMRACHDIDLLVRPDARVRAVSTLVEEGFTAVSDASSISRGLVLSRGVVDIDLHWGLLREGRLRRDPTTDMIERRRLEKGIWMLSADDALFVFLVHPAFAKHLAGWGMGLHRVADIAAWLRTESFDWETVLEQLDTNGVRTAAWATLRWVQMLTSGSDFTHDRSGSYFDQCLWERLQPRFLDRLDTMISDLCPGRLRQAWLDRWLRSDISERASAAHWARLLGFSLFLHDTPSDAVRALAGRYRAHRSSRADLAVFRDLVEPGDL
jgi:hypothetical protein